MTKLKKTQSSESLKRAIVFLDIDMTMEQLGKRLGYSKAAVSKYLSGFPPSKSFLLKFEEIFNVNLDDFNTEEYAISQEEKERRFRNNAKQEVMTESEILKELVNELRERVIDLKESLENEKQSKEYFKKEYESLKTDNLNSKENNSSINEKKL